MPRKDRIEKLLHREFSPLFLQVEDESKNHHVPQGAQTHFKIVMAAKTMTTLPRIDRHKLLNKLLKAEFDTGMHALSMHLYSPDEWLKYNQQVLSSPSCKDGYKNKLDENS